MTIELGSLAEIITLITETQSRLDTSWALFLSINSAIIGGVVLIERTFNLIEKSIIIIIYSTLSSLNYLVTHNIINQLHALYKDVAMLEFAPNQAGYQTISYFSHFLNGDDFWANPWFILGIYVSAFILTTICVIFDEKLTTSIK